MFVKHLGIAQPLVFGKAECGRRHLRAGGAATLEDGPAG
jgi:hypothetical protein